MESIILVAQTLFTGVWNLLLNTNFPGTEISLAALSITVMIIVFMISIFKLLTGFSMGGSTYGRAADSVEKVKSARDNRDAIKLSFRWKP